MKVFIIVLLAILFSGCKETGDNQSATVGNQEINCLRVDLGISNEEFMERVSHKKKTPDLDLLKRIHLPANASLCEIRDFVDLILFASQNQSSFYKTDPQINMIKMAINNHEEEFLAIAKAHWHTPSSYVKDALIELLGNGRKKDVVKRNLAKYEWLIQVVVENNWSEDFREEIERIVTENQGAVSYNYGAAFAQINDPNTKDIILSILSKGSGNRHVTYAFIKNIDWLDPIPTLKEIWLSDNVTSLELESFTYPLIRSGFFPALDYTVQNIDKFARSSPYQKNYDLLNAVTNQSLAKDEIKKWVMENRENLKFNPESKQYYVTP